MAGITPEFKDRLLGRVDIVDLIQSRVPLKRAGGIFKACCPFHDEKTPSFTVTPSRQTYHCFGCDAHGNAIGFLMEYDRLGFREAVETLAEYAGMELPTDGGPGTGGPDPTPLYDLLQQAAALYRRQLREHPDAARAVNYLKGRGLSGAIAARFGIGFAPPGWDFLLRALGSGPAVVAQLVSAGLIIEGDGGKRYDRFRDRIMFPIHDRRGRVIGFGGRVLGEGEPKYLNSPETPLFHKGRELYGLYETQQVRRKLARLLVVEGYMDVIALAQYGIDNAVATLGTATTPEHIKRLLRSAPELVFCFDGDRAGRAAAWKALETALPQATGAQPIRFMFLPDGEDPDTLIRKEEAAAFAQRLGAAPLLSGYLMTDLGQRFDLTSIEGRSAFSDEADRLLGLVPPGSFREQLAQEFARVVPRAPTATPGRADYGPGRGNPRARSGAVATPRKLTPLRLAIALLLDNPDLAEFGLARPADWRALDAPGVALLSQLLDTIAAQPGINSGQLEERWRDTEQQSILAALAKPGLLDHIPTSVDGRMPELVGAIDTLNRQALEAQRQRRLQARLSARQGGPSNDRPAGPDGDAH